MADSFDVDAMIQRFQDRAKAVKNRSMPPVEGPARADFKRQAQLDFMDFGIIGDATGRLEGSRLVLEIDLGGGS